MRSLLLFSWAVGLLLFAGCGGTPDEDAAYADAMAVQHADDTTQPSAIVAPEPDLSITADTVTYGEGLTGYLAVPEQPDSLLKARGYAPRDSLPALIVVHEWWGLNDNIRKMTRRLAGEGYRALAVDLYGDAVAQTPEEAQVLVSEVLKDMEAIDENLQAAYQYLAEAQGAPRVGVIGWCFGGTAALEAMVTLPKQLDAAVIYYGGVQHYAREQFQPLAMPVLAFFGAEDGSIPVEAVERFEQTMNELDKNIQVHVYENAGHAFANPTGENYVAKAAKDSWKKTTAFLNTYLWSAE